jgi:iron complex outermembrane receptor protein
MQVSINNISRIEVTKVPTPANPADGISGSVNMVSKSAFERSPRPAPLRVFSPPAATASAPSSRTLRHLGAIYRVNPGFDFDYTLPITKTFGIVSPAPLQSPGTSSNISTTTWNATAAGTGATPARPVPPAVPSSTPPSGTTRNSASLKADWRVTPNSVLSVGLQATYYIDTNGNVNRTASAGTNATPRDRRRHPLSFGPDFTIGATGRGAVNLHCNLLHIDARTLGRQRPLPLRRRHLAIETVAYASTSKTWRRYDTSKGHFQPPRHRPRQPRARHLRRHHPRGPTDLEAFDNSNRPLDLATTSTTTGSTPPLRRAYRDHLTNPGLDASVKRSLGFLSIPAAVQIGGLVPRRTATVRRQRSSGPTRPPGGNRSTTRRSPCRCTGTARTTSTTTPCPWVSNNRMAEAWGKSGLFTQTPAQLVTRSNRINGSRISWRDHRRSTRRARLRLFRNRLLVLTGVRYEKPTPRAPARSTTPDAAWVRIADGSFARTAAGARIRKPEAGAAGSMEELRLIRFPRGRAPTAPTTASTPASTSPTTRANFLAPRRLRQTYGRPDFANIIPNTTIDENDNSRQHADPDGIPGVRSSSATPASNRGPPTTSISPPSTTPRPAALFSAGVFRKDIALLRHHRDLRHPGDLEQLGLDPQLRRLAAAHHRQLRRRPGRAASSSTSASRSRPLGGWGRYFSVFANATKLKLEGSRTAAFTRFVPESFNWGVTVTRAPSPHGSSGTTAANNAQALSDRPGPRLAYLYQEKRTTIDINLTYQVTAPSPSSPTAATSSTSTTTSCATARDPGLRQAQLHQFLRRPVGLRRERHVLIP